MPATLIGYARCSTADQNLAAQRQALVELGVPADRVYTDHGLTGTNRARPGLDQALAATREGDTLVVTKLDRLARSIPDARAIADQLTARGARLAIGRTLYDPADPIGKMFFNVLATFAEFESDLIRARTREGMAIARAKGKLRGKQPNCRPGSSANCAACTKPANIRSAISQNSSRSRARPSTGRSSADELETTQDPQSARTHRLKGPRGRPYPPLPVTGPTLIRNSHAPEGWLRRPCRWRRICPAHPATIRPEAATCP